MDKWINKENESYCTHWYHLLVTFPWALHLCLTFDPALTVPTQEEMSSLTPESSPEWVHAALFEVTTYDHNYA